MQRALEAAVAELVLGASLDVSDAGAVEAWFDRHGLDATDRDALRGRELERWLVYRELVRGTLYEAVRVAIPRVMARLGAVFDRYFDRFLAERGPRTHYLRDVTTELLEFCAPLWRDDSGVPAYALDLARHEALHIEIAATPRGAARPSDAPLELDAGLDFTEAARLVHYEFAVHRLPESIDDRSEPEARATDLFVYRSPDHEVRYLELTPLARALLERLMAGASLRNAIESAAGAGGASLDEALLSGTARLLSDLAERGAVLGVRSYSAASKPASIAAGEGAPFHPESSSHHD